MFVCPIMMFVPSRLPSPLPERSFFCPTCCVMFYRDPTMALLCTVVCFLLHMSLV